jgi:radical SAM superfamily enzyme YgiQ (UPF0313 family)
MDGFGDPYVKCCLIRCPQTIEKYISAAYAVPPIGLAYVAASLVKAGHEVQIIDPTGEAIDQFAPLDGDLLRRGLSDDEILERIHCSDLIGFSLMFSQDWLPARALIEKVRARFPEAVTVAGGEHFTAEPEGALREAPGLRRRRSCRSARPRIGGRRGSGTSYRWRGVAACARATWA